MNRILRYGILTTTFLLSLVSLHTPVSAASYNFDYLASEGINVITRAEWGCPDMDPTSPNYCEKPEWQSFKNPISHIIIHHTVTKNDATDWKAEVRNIWKLHALTREWGDIAYNYLIDPDGNIYEGKQGGEFSDGGHTGGGNAGTVGIALIGNYEEKELPKPAYDSLIKLTTTLVKRYKLYPLEEAVSFGDITNERISGHGNWNSTQCPGKFVITRLDEIKSNIAINVLKDDPNAPLCDYKYQLDDKLCVKNSVRASTSIANAMNGRIFEFDSNGKMYFTSFDITEVFALNSNGSLEVMTTLVNQTMDMYLDEERGKLYLLQFANDTVISLDLESKDMELVGFTGDGPRSITGDAAGNLYISNIYDNSITKIDINGEESKLADTGNYPVKIAVDSNGDVYTANFMDHTVTHVSPSGMVVHIPLKGGLPRDLVIDKNDNVFVLNEGTATIDLIQNDTATTFTDLPLQANKMYQNKDGEWFILHNNFNAYSTMSPTKEIKTHYLGEVGKKWFIYNSANDDITLLDPQENKFYRISVDVDEENAEFPVYRFWSNAVQGHFYTADSSEKDYIVQTYPEDTWKLEGSIMRTLLKDNDDTKPIYRYWNNNSRSHLYTIDPAEKKQIDDTNPAWKYEGVAMYAYQKDQTSKNLIPVYRFWSTTLAKHFYTASEEEKENIEEQYDEEVWKYEGIAYYTYKL